MFRGAATTTSLLCFAGWMWVFSEPYARSPDTSVHAWWYRSLAVGGVALATVCGVRLWLPRIAYRSGIHVRHRFAVTGLVVGAIGSLLLSGVVFRIVEGI